MHLIDIFKGTQEQVIAVLSGTLVAVSDGMAYGWPSPNIPYLLSDESHIPITHAQADLIETMGLIGAFCGLPFTLYFVQKIGRKLSIQLSALFELISWVLVCFGTNVPWLLVGRFVNGMAGNMCFVAAPMYIAEIADHKVRGFLSSLIYLMMLLGMLIVYTVSAYGPYYATPVIGIILNSVQLIIFSFMPESAHYLVQNNNVEKAKKSLKKLKPGVDPDVEIKNIKGALERQKQEKSKNIVRDLILVKSNRKAILIMTMLNVGQHFAGMSVLYMNLHIILQEADSIYMDTKISAIVFVVSMLVAAVITSFLMDFSGRRVLLILSSIFTAFCLLAIAIYFHTKNLGYDVTLVSWIPAASVMIYAAVFKFGLGLVPIVVTAEIFSHNIKAVGMTLADATYIVTGIASLQVYYILYNSFGMHVPFYLFATCSFLLALFTYFCIPETKGKTLDEIQQMLENRKASKPLEH